MGTKIAVAVTHLRFFVSKLNRRKWYGSGMEVLDIKI